ncbi:RrF2 family transcriptional regulator [Stakelama marina]|uniref:Rrf2 family transcriptional regulator n=1 Tax=Stakelama marina TaxID=2826939 RepID=A0A8T4IC52_9SPHN|nr:Rrf2 family transcriptional regulator [Stakelama marina]MBR0552033.1 Rrf2 family transcriptional regulator [Stakelama marina]
MRLTRYSDYAMRVLLHLGAEPSRLSSITEIADAYQISRNHLTKVVHGLAKAGFVDSIRGRAGGIRLARPADQINLGTVLRLTEEGFDLVDCANCVIAPACGLTAVVNEALSAFLAVFDSYSLADILGRRDQLLKIFESQRTAL